MSSRARKAKPTPSSRWSLPLFLLVAFVLGVGTTWLLLRPASAPAPVIQNFLPPTSGPATASAGFAAGEAQAPDVSTLPKAEGERVLANWNYDRQNWAHAIEHYERAIAGGIDNPDVRTDLGNCYRFLGQPEKALAQYQLAQTQNPQHENSLFNQISLFSDLLNDKNRAAAAARDFITRFPLSPQAAKARQQLGASNPASTP
ncbi:MAG: tetratricopeptide repeat protein [Chthoniobacterales bacterium]